MRISFYIILLFLWGCNSKNLSKKTIGLQPYFNFPKHKTDSIARLISDFYNVNVYVLPSIKLPSNAYINLKSSRYRADSLIKFQKNNKVDSLDYIMGLTNQYISTTKRNEFGKIKQPIYKYHDWGIMGLAYCPGNSCVISTFRLQHANEKVHFSRLKKIAVHEFGHNLGLPHCKNKQCVMTDAVESIATVDNAKLDLCENCKSKL